MGRELDIGALRSFTAIADHGGFHRAAAAVGLTQSAVSQQVRRLEKAVGRPLVRREGRTSRFTTDGEILLDEARKILAAHDAALARLGLGERDGATIVVGSTEHASDRLLPAITAALGVRYPGRDVRFRLDRSARLNEGLDRGAIDVAVFLGDVGERGGAPAGLLPLSWFSAPQWQPPSGDGPLPVVVIHSPCTIRRLALDTLSQEGLTAQVVAEAGYLAGVVNAVRAGLGVGLLADVGPPPEGLVRRADLPPVPPEPLHLRSRAELGAGLADVAQVTAAAVSAALS